HEQLSDSVALDIDADGAAHQLAPATEHRHRMLLWTFVAEQHFLGPSTSVPERDRLPGIELDPFFGQCRGGEVSEGEVHVIATDERVIADRDPAKGEFSPFFSDADEGEVGG